MVLGLGFKIPEKLKKKNFIKNDLLIHKRNEGLYTSYNLLDCLSPQDCKNMDAGCAFCLGGNIQN